ncbi:MAG: cyanophycin synthetase, partial [Firmicutes bacterium]|nr:cyanophycin synthetase [Bacillota bacterium]
LGPGSLLRLGTGCYNRYIEATITGLTSCIGVDIACDKTITNKLLNEAMIPTPRGKVARDEEHAVEIAQELGGKVVVKPCDGNQGKGVSLNLLSEAEVRAAYKVAENYSNNIIVEEQIEGRHYRLLVVNGRVEAAAERFPAQVTGDGVHSIKELIEIENQNKLRGEGHEKPLTRIRADQVMFNVLARQNLTMNYVPEKDESINLRDNANLSTGGTAEDVTDIVHPDNMRLAERAARVLNLDVAGIDIVTADIASPLIVDAGAVIEVNAAPGIRMHLFPSHGKRRPVGDAIVDYLFPWHRRHSIPVLSVTGTNGKTTTSRLIAHTLHASGKKVGLASTDGIYIDGALVDQGDNTGPVSADVVLSDPLVEVAVLETARGGMVRRGLGYSVADVGVVTNIAADHLGLDGIETLEDLAHVKSLVVETVSSKGYAVLNADDGRVLAMAERCPGKVILYSRSPNKEFLRHLSEGGRGVTVQHNAIYFLEGESRVQVAALAEIEITFNGRAGYNVENCLAAAGALWGLDVSPSDIARGLTSFDSKVHNPGRANLYTFGDVRVLIDYGHNPEGYQQILNLARGLDAKQLIGVVGVPGDRRDEDIKTVGGICGQFDKVYVKEDKDLRDRSPGEVSRILADAAKAARPGLVVEEIACELEALQKALLASEPGDLIVMFYEKLAPVRDLLFNYRSKTSSAKSRNFASTGELYSVNLSGGDQRLNRK